MKVFLTDQAIYKYYIDDFSNKLKIDRLIKVN